MYKRVNEGTVDDFEGFSYLNVYNEEEFVKVNSGNYDISISIDGSTVHVFDQDVPNLIRALQAAYDYKETNGQ